MALSDHTLTLCHDLQDDWDASEDEEEKKPAKPAGPPPPVRAKGITKMKIAEKEAAERAAAEERARRVSTILLFVRKIKPAHARQRTTS